jgi:hypothetical protein
MRRRAADRARIDMRFGVYLHVLQRYFRDAARSLASEKTLAEDKYQREGEVD